MPSNVLEEKGYLGRIEEYGITTKVFFLEKYCKISLKNLFKIILELITDMEVINMLQHPFLFLFLWKGQD